MSDLFGPAPMPALSLWQPWASLIAAGFKRHETRHWATPVRGPVAIHAAKRMDAADAPRRLCNFAFGQGWATSLPRGEIIAVAHLSECFYADLVARDPETFVSDLEAGNFAPGRFAFRFDIVRPLREPLPLIGRQGFFTCVRDLCRGGDGPMSPAARVEIRYRDKVSHDARAMLALGRGGLDLMERGLMHWPAGSWDDKCFLAAQGDEPLGILTFTEDEDDFSVNVRLAWVKRGHPTVLARLLVRLRARLKGTRFRALYFTFHDENADMAKITRVFACRPHSHTVRLEIATLTGVPSL